MAKERRGAAAMAGGFGALVLYLFVGIMLKVDPSVEVIAVSGLSTIALGAAVGYRVAR